MQMKTVIEDSTLFTIPTETSWHFERILKPDDKTIGNYVLIQPGAADIAKVLTAYFHHPVPAYNIASIEIVYNEQLNRLFYGQMKMMNVRKGNIKYTPSWRTKTQGAEKQHREKSHQLLQNLAESHRDPDVPNMSILPLWHGTSDDVAEHIFNTGYGIFMANDPAFVTDDGFFGKGVYTAHEAEYAFRSYAQKHIDKAVLLLNCVSTLEAFPVIDGDMPHLRGKMGGFDQCDAHFIPVRSNQHPHTNVYVPCRINESHHYQEMVVFSSAQCLPRYRVKLVKSLPQFNIIVDDTTYQMGLDCLGLGQYGMVAEVFENACDAGHPAASIRLHWLHSGASGVIPANLQELAKYQHPPQSTVAYLKRKANFRGENDPEAQFNLAWCHQQGLGTPVDSAKAAQYYWLAARQGHREARYQLGVCCATGTGVKQDMKKAIFYYEQAAAQGHVHAHYLLSQCYESGFGVVPDTTKAQIHKQAAQQGHHPKLEIITRLEQAVSAEKKESQAKDKTIIDLEQIMTHRKRQLEQQLEQINILTQTASAKEQKLQDKNMIITRNESDLKLQQDKIIEQEERLKENERDYMHILEQLQLQQKNITDQAEELTKKEGELKTKIAEVDPLKKESQGLKEYQKQHPLIQPQQEQSAELQHDPQTEVELPEIIPGERSYKRAQHFLSRDEPEKALRYLEKSIQEGYPPAYVSLGTECYKKAASEIEWLKAQAAKESVDAQNSLGLCYYYGIGVEKDDAQTVKYYKRAAEQNNMMAQNSLAICYREGIGTNQDLTKSAEYFQLASQQGNENAKAHLENLKLAKNPHGFFAQAPAIHQNTPPQLKNPNIPAQQENCVLQ